ncbi:hypothetical protein ACJZ2D_014331 [Fusarium nematophilum]
MYWELANEKGRSVEMPFPGSVHLQVPDMVQLLQSGGLGDMYPAYGKDIPPWSFDDIHMLPNLMVSSVGAAFQFLQDSKVGKNLGMAEFRAGDWTRPSFRAEGVHRWLEQRVWFRCIGTYQRGPGGTQCRMRACEEKQKFGDGLGVVSFAQTADDDTELYRKRRAMQIKENCAGHCKSQQS